MPLPHKTWSLGTGRLDKTPSWDQPAPPEKPPTDPAFMAEVFKETPLLRVRSWLLGGEVVVFAGENVRVPEGTVEVVYRASELQMILELSPQQLIALHQTKKALDGDLIGLVNPKKEE